MQSTPIALCANRVAELWYSCTGVKGLHAALQVCNLEIPPRPAACNRPNVRVCNGSGRPPLCNSRVWRCLLAAWRDDEGRNRLPGRTDQEAHVMGSFGPTEEEYVPLMPNRQTRFFFGKSALAALQLSRESRFGP